MVTILTSFRGYLIGLALMLICLIGLGRFGLVYGSCQSPDIEAEIKDFQNKTIQSLKKASELETQKPSHPDGTSRKALCYSPGKKPFYVSEDLILRVASYDKKAKKVIANNYGTHAVKSFQGAHYKVCHEINILDPIGEIAYFDFQKLLVGGRVPPSFFMAAQTSLEKPFYFQISQTVKGDNLHDKGKEYFYMGGHPPTQKIESKSLSDFLLTSFFVCPIDAKLDNFMVTPTGKIVSIDNDLCFGLGLDIYSLKKRYGDGYFFDSDSDSVTPERSSSETDLLPEASSEREDLKDLDVDIDVKNIFYLDSLFMKQTVHPETWLQVNRLKPEVLMLEWLTLCHYHNHKLHKCRIDFQSSSKEKFQKIRKKKGKDLFPPSLKLFDLDMVSLLRRLKRLSSLDLPAEERHFETIFSSVAPLISLYVKRHRQDYSNPVTALSDMYRVSFDFEKYIPEHEVVEDGKNLSEMKKLWKQRYLDSQQDTMISPKGIARLLFLRDPRVIQKLETADLSPKARRFWQGLCEKASIWGALDMLGGSFASLKEEQSPKIQKALRTFFETGEESFSDLLLSPRLQNHFRKWPTRSADLSYPDEPLSLFDLEALYLAYQEKAPKDHLKTLDFGRVEEVLYPESFSRFVSLLQASLVDLFLNDLPFSQDQWKSLWHPLEKMTSLKRLVLARSGYPSSATDWLAQSVLNRFQHLRILDLSGNALFPQALLPLQALLGHPTLEMLDFRKNGFDDEAVMAFSSKAQKGLPICFFSGNPLSQGVAHKTDQKFATLLLQKAFRDQQENLFDFLLHFELDKEFYDYILGVYADPKKSRGLCQHERFSPVAVSVAGFGLSHQAQARKKLFLKGFAFEQENFAYLYQNFFHDLTTLTTVSFHQGQVRPPNVNPLISFLKQNKSLKKIIFEDNTWDKDSFCAILPALKDLKFLKKLTFNISFPELHREDLSFNKAVLETLEVLPCLSTFAWKGDYKPDAFMKGIQELQEKWRLHHIQKTRQKLENRQLILKPSDVVSLLTDLSLDREKISDLTGLQEPTFDKDSENSDPLTDLTVQNTLKTYTPKIFEKEILKQEGFFKIRYGLKSKEYDLIAEKKDFLFLLLSQPVKNPYRFTRTGLSLFKDTYLEAFKGEERYQIDGPEVLCKTLTKDYQSNTRNPALTRAALFSKIYLRETLRVSRFLGLVSDFLQSLEKSENSLYLEGIETLYAFQKKNHYPLCDKTFTFFKQRALSDPNTCYELSQVYQSDSFCEEGLSDTERLTTAQDYLRKAADLGHPQAQFECGLLSWEEALKCSHTRKRGNLNHSALIFFQKAALQGHVRARDFVSILVSNPETS